MFKATGVVTYFLVTKSTQADFVLALKKYLKSAKELSLQITIYLDSLIGVLYLGLLWVHSLET